MKLKFKKYIYLLNDITNTLLKKDRAEEGEEAEKLRKWLIIVSIILALSIALNIYFYFFYAKN